MHRKRQSLLWRLGVASLTVLPVLLGFSAITLNRTYVRSLDAAEYDAMLAQIYALIALAEPDSGSLVLPSAMANPRFEMPNSGLYAQVVDERAQRVWLSNSLILSPINFEPQSPAAAGRVDSDYIELDTRHFRRLSYTTIWELAGQDHLFRFDLFNSQQAKRREIRAYQHSLLVWLGAMALLLVILLLGIAYWGLRPLSGLAREIEAIEKAEKSRIDGDYPSEIEPVITNMNQLLTSEQTQRERYKNSLADLAHSLKTPLSVIRTQMGVADDERDRIIDEQIVRMAGIIEHQLKRASAEVKKVYGPSVALLPLVTRLSKALSKVYYERQLSVEIDIEPGIHSHMDENDLMECLGNLMENGAKYGRGRLRVTARKQDRDLLITIEDNGSGVAPDIARDILQRGARADTAQQGQGIGLSIAVDILSSYNGALRVESSDLGGAAFVVLVPA